MSRRIRAPTGVEGSNLLGVSPDAPTVDHRALLEAERGDLIAKLEELGLGGAGLTYDSNFADSSQVTAERGEAEALGASLRETLEDVERALAKLTDGSYGACEDCGQPIDPLRLEAKPAARYCINCAAKH
jgi:DnaK suppressor protein